MGYSTFTVTSPGAFTIFTTGTTVDPVLYLVTGTTDALGAMLERDDDCAGVPGLCGPSGGYGNAIINGRPLDSGTYTVAVGDYHFSEEEARSGNNDAARFGDVGITITSRDGIAVLAGQVAVVPEPGSVILLGTGLAGPGAVGVVRRRRTRAE